MLGLINIEAHVESTN